MKTITKKIFNSNILKSFTIVFVLGFMVLGLSACSPKEEDSLITESSASSTNSETNSDNSTPDTESDNSTSDVSTSAEPYYFDNLKFVALDGSEASLYDYEGQIIMLNFWATWCKYCDEEMPLLNEINKRDDVTVLAVDVAEDADTVNAYLERFDFDLEIFLDESSELASYFGITGYPTTIFIGPDFEYYYTYPGMLTEESLNQILDAIDAYRSDK